MLVRKRNGQNELVLLDHGLYQQLTEKDRIALSNLWKAIVMNSHEDMKKYSLELGVNGTVHWYNKIKTRCIKYYYRI